MSNVLDDSKRLRCIMTMSAPLYPACHEAIHSSRIITGPIAEEWSGFRKSPVYALRWEFSNYRGEVLVWYTGGLPGFGTIMIFFQRLQCDFIMMTNSGKGGMIQFLIFNKKLGTCYTEQERFN